MTAAVEQPQAHPVIRAVAGAHALLDELAGLPVWSLGAAESAAALVEVSRLRSRVHELELRLARQAEAVDVAGERGASSTANWWAHETRSSRPEAHRLTRLATGLERWTLVGDALAAGAVNCEQARVVVHALEELPTDLGTDLAAQAEARLVELATDHEPRVLRVLGRRILEVVAPDVAEAHEARLLEREEREAARAASLTMRDDGHGRTHGRFTLPTLQAEMLRTALRAIAAPKHQGANGVPQPETRVPTAERLGRAFCEYVERYPADALPRSGGVNASVMVTMTLETLLGGLAAASIDTGHRISPGGARRLACTAGIIPAVLGGPSQVLDLGRRRRFHTPAQRIALALRDGGCSAEGCDAPPSLCHAHHDEPWSRGGATSLGNARLLCPRHHSYAHDPRFALERRPHGKLRFHRRT